MFTSIKNFTAKYLLTALLLSGVFFGFSDVVLADEVSPIEAPVAVISAPEVPAAPVVETPAPAEMLPVVPASSFAPVTTEVPASPTLEVVVEATTTTEVVETPVEATSTSVVETATSSATSTLPEAVASSTVATSTIEVGTTTASSTIADQAPEAEVLAMKTLAPVDDVLLDTLADATSTGEVVSDEVGTGSATSTDEVISPEGETATLPDDTCTTNCGEIEVVSPEQDFSTLPDICTGCCGTNCPPDNDEVISPEGDFNTLPDICTGCCGTNCPPANPEVISGELGFDTPNDTCTGCCGTNCPPENDEVISPELDFTTDKKSGGGGGGGGCKRCGDDDTDTLLPPGCKPLLRQFIKFGAQNDPYEVRKLQAFLVVYEGYNLPITGVYDLATERAVRAFQSKYASDVLIPWGIADNTGYVYITTLIKINYIYCGITEPITLDLRSRFPGLEIGPNGLQEIEKAFENTTTTEILLPNPENASSTSLFQLAAAGLLKGLDFLWNHLCELAWLLILILLGIIAYLLFRLRELKQRLAKYEDGANGAGLVAAASAGAIATPVAVPLEDMVDDESADEVVEDDNWQEYLETPVVLPLETPASSKEGETPVVGDSADEATYETDLKNLLEALSNKKDKNK